MFWINRFHRGLVAVLLISFGSCLPAGTAYAACLFATSSAEPMPTVVPLRRYDAGLHAPARLAIDSADNIYISDPQRNRVVIRSPDGTVLRIVDDLDFPVGIAVAADGRIYLGESATGRVTVFDANWQAQLAFGQGDGEFDEPGDIAIDPATGNVYIMDGATDVVRVFTADGVPVTTIGGSGAAEGLFSRPTGMTIDTVNGELLVMDQGNFRVSVYDLAGNYDRCLGFVRISSFSPDAAFERGAGVWVDPTGRIYVVDTLVGNVKLFDSNGGVIGALGRYGTGRGELRIPVDLVGDSFGRLFVSSANNGRVEVFGLGEFSDPETAVPAEVVMQVDSLQRDTAEGNLFAYLEIPGYRSSDVDPLTMTLNGVPAIAATVGDRDQDAVSDLTVEFDAPSVIATLPDGFGEVAFAGQVLGFSFQATQPVFVQATAPEEPPDEPATVKGGCTIAAPGQFDHGTLLWALLAMFGLTFRAWRRSRG